MERQCAGCGKVFEDGKEPLGFASPRPYGCCDDCNKTTFRSEEGKAAAQEAPAAEEALAEKPKARSAK
jgi:predicted  nucleic acid-binding Zn-ribbon protein